MRNEAKQLSGDAKLRQMVKKQLALGTGIRGTCNVCAAKNPSAQGRMTIFDINGIRACGSCWKRAIGEGVEDFAEAIWNRKQKALFPYEEPNKLVPLCHGCLRWTENPRAWAASHHRKQCRGCGKPTTIRGRAAALTLDDLDDDLDEAKQQKLFPYEDPLKMLPYCHACLNNRIRVANASTYGFGDKRERCKGCNTPTIVRTPLANLIGEAKEKVKFHVTWQRGEPGRGWKTPQGSVWMWPEDWANHAKFAYVHSIDTQKSKPFFIGDGGEIFPDYWNDHPRDISDKEKDELEKVTRPKKKKEQMESFISQLLGEISVYPSIAPADQDCPDCRRRTEHFHKAGNDLVAIDRWGGHQYPSRHASGYITGIYSLTPNMQRAVKKAFDRPHEEGTPPYRFDSHKPDIKQRHLFVPPTCDCGQRDEHMHRDPNDPNVMILIPQRQ